MAETMKSIYINCAATLGLGDLTKLGTKDKKRGQIITDCANGYVQATKDNNDALRSAYISALMLLFWGEINKMADKCKAISELEYDDFASKLYECIETACKYNAWANGSNTAEACIRSVIASRGAAALLYDSNLDKNKANINSYSLDTTISDKDGHETSRGDMVEDEGADPAQLVERPADKLIQDLVDKNKIEEAIILENIATSMCEKYTKTTAYQTIHHTKEDGTDEETQEKYTKTTIEFWSYRLIKNIKEMPTDYFNYFRSRYNVKDDVLIAALANISKTPNTKLYKKWDKTKEMMKTPEVRALLMGN